MTNNSRGKSAMKHPQKKGKHILQIINPSLTDKDIQKYYDDRKKSLDDIRERRILGEHNSRHIVLD